MAGEDIPCKRPYSLGKRLEQSDSRRAKILATAREQLESGGLPNLKLDTLARASGVTRQTVYNLFRTKAGVIDALFDQIALGGGMEQMQFVMQQRDPAAMLKGFIEVFTKFWSKDRMLMRRIHGIAAVDPEFGVAVAARNQRRQMASRRVAEVICARGADDKEGKAKVLYGLTSFEFFDALAEVCDSTQEAAQMVQEIAIRAVAADGNRRASD